MSKKQKLRDRFNKRPSPKDFRWEELLTMMRGYGFSWDQSGGGSHGHFVFNEDKDKVIDISKTHPNGILLQYQIDGIQSKLSEWGIE